MSPANPTFQWSDAWLLAAIAVGGGLKGAMLKEVVAAGDLINRSHFTPQELRSGLAKLFHRGYAMQLGDRFVIAGDARVELVNALQHPFSSFSVMQFFENFLNSRPYDSLDRARVDPDWCFAELTDETVAGARAQYQSEVETLGTEALKHSILGK